MELDKLFDERTYLDLYPDVAAAVTAGEFASGERHYIAFGRDEGRALRSRTDASKGRILITGTGRAGTTLLVQILTALRFDTGFSREESLTRVDPFSHAGLEHTMSPYAPLVVKSPWLADSLSHDLKQSSYPVNFVIVPMRQLDHAAESRRRVGHAAVERGEDPMQASGGLWLTDKPSNQEEILLGQFYKIVYACAQNSIQPKFLDFPQFATDESNLYQALSSVWQLYGVGYDELKAAHHDVVDLRKINYKI